jgi:arylsulfatase A-like enzyme
MNRLLALSLALVAAAPSQDRKPNIVFILADDLGYGDLGCYGQKRIKTPNLDRMAAEGTRFTQFYAGSTVCAPSRCVLMTGLHTGHCYIRGNAKVDLRPEDVTVAKVLKGAGYATGLCGKWGLGHEGSTGTPNKQGFDFFFGYMDQTHAHNYYPTFLMRNEERVGLRNVVPKEGPVGQGVATERVDYSPDLIHKEALAFIEANRARPFFLYYASTLPHANNEAGKQGMEIPDYGDYAKENWPDPEKGRAAMISRLDRDVGQVLSKLKELGIEKETLVLFSSDNGPHREGGADPDFFDCNGPLKGTKRSLHDGGIRVPMIAHWPGRVLAGRVSDRVWGMVDFLPTAAELSGTRPPGSLDGQSEAEHLFRKIIDGSRVLYWEFFESGFHQAVRLGDWKAVRHGLDGKLELYDLKADIGEGTNIADRHPEEVAKIEDYLRAARTESEHWKPAAGKGKGKGK